MPNDTIDRAIKKGTGELGGAAYEEVRLRRLRARRARALVEVHDRQPQPHRRRAALLLSRHGGNLGESDCVGWMFKKRGVITVERSAIDEDRLMELSLEAGADDVVADSEAFR